MNANNNPITSPMQGNALAYRTTNAKGDASVIPPAVNYAPGGVADQPNSEVAAATPQNVVPSSPDAEGQAQRAFTFDQDITVANAPRPYVVLAPGRYRFTIDGLSHNWYPGSAKLPACDQAVLTLLVDGGRQGVGEVKVYLPLCSAMIWKLVELLRSVGLLPKDFQDGIIPATVWGQLVGRAGTCQLTVYDSGSGRTRNQVDHFLTE